MDNNLIEVKYYKIYEVLETHPQPAYRLQSVSDPSSTVGQVMKLVPDTSCSTVSTCKFICIVESLNVAKAICKTNPRWEYTEVRTLINPIED